MTDTSQPGEPRKPPRDWGDISVRVFLAAGIVFVIWLVRIKLG